LTTTNFAGWTGSALNDYMSFGGIEHFEDAAP